LRVAVTAGGTWEAMTAGDRHSGESFQALAEVVRGLAETAAKSGARV
jgi:hypothetical protein